MKTPRISVVMPAYNSEKYIGEAIESVLNQTFTDFELLVLNDSPDNKELEKIVKEYAAQDKRVKYMKNPKNLGLGDSRNVLLEHCCGEFIACMDSDDVSMPTRFEKQIEYMEKHPECGVLGTCYQMFGNKNDTIILPSTVNIMNLLHYCCIGNPTVMMRKSLFDKYNLKYNADYNSAEDFELWSRMVFITEIRNLPEVLLRYRWHGNNISVRIAQTQADLADRVKRNILNKLSDNQKQQEFIMDCATGKYKKTGILLPKFIGRIICLFIFNRDARHNFRDKYIKG